MDTGPLWRKHAEQDFKSNCSAELNKLLKEGPFGRSRQGQAAWWERMAELFDLRASELIDAGFPTLGEELGSVAEYHRQRAKELWERRGERRLPTG